MNQDRNFLVSRGALWRLYDTSRARQCSQGYLFRTWAYELAHAENPKFDITGQQLDRAFHVGVNEDVYAALISVADQLDVPREAIGEMVMSFVEGVYVAA